MNHKGTKITNKIIIHTECEYNDDASPLVEVTELYLASAEDWFNLDLFIGALSVYRKLIGVNIDEYDNISEILTKEESDIIVDFELYKYSTDEESLEDLAKYKEYYKENQYDFRDEMDRIIDSTMNEFFPTEHDNGSYPKFLNGCYCINKIKVTYFDNEGVAYNL